MKISRKAFVAAGLVGLLAVVAVWLGIPWSPMKRRFRRDLARGSQQGRLPDEGQPLRAEEFAHLPAPLQRFVSAGGYLGTPRRSSLELEFRDVSFKQGRDRALTIDYTLCNRVGEPWRLALIDSSVMGIPFEGIDSYRDGRGRMKGVVAKAFTVFDETGPEMDQGAALTFLSEAVFCPAMLLQDYVEFQQIDEHHVRVTLHDHEVTCTGVYEFNNRDELVAFTTQERAQVSADGTSRRIPWTAACTHYRRGADGINRPTRFTATWHEPEGDLVYFDGTISRMV